MEVVRDLSVPEIAVETEELLTTMTQGRFGVFKEMNQNHLDAKLDVSSSSETSLGNDDDDCFKRFQNTLSSKIEKIETWMKSTQDIVYEMKFDLNTSNKLGSKVKQLEAEIVHLKRTSPLTIGDDKERDTTIQIRALRLKEIKSELLSIMVSFERLQRRHDDQCAEIAENCSCILP